MNIYPHEHTARLIADALPLPDPKGMPSYDDEPTRCESILGRDGELVGHVQAQRNLPDRTRAALGRLAEAAAQIGHEDEECDACGRCPCTCAEDAQAEAETVAWLLQTRAGREIAEGRG